MRRLALRASCAAGLSAGCRRREGHDEWWTEHQQDVVVPRRLKGLKRPGLGEPCSVRGGRAVSQCDPRSGGDTR